MRPNQLYYNMMGHSPAPSTLFKMTISGSTFSIPLRSGYTYSCVIDWGDGATSSQTTDISPVHTYSTDGTYQIKISGRFDAIYFNGDGVDQNPWKVMSIDNWGNIQWKTFEQAFATCYYLVGTFIDSPDLSQVTNMSNMFRECNLAFNSNINGWDVSNVTDMSYMFDTCQAFNQPLDGWNVSNVTNMEGMLRYTQVFNQTLNSWDVSNVTNMSYLFYASVMNSTISSWDTSSVTNMSWMFGGSLFNKSINSWDVSNVTNMDGMFGGGNNSFNQPLNNWNVVSLTTAVGFMPSSLSAYPYLDGIYSSWSLLTLQPGVVIDFIGIEYTSAGAAGKAILEGSPNNWVITDGGEV